MRKILPVVLFSLIFLCGCVYDRGLILFNKEPVNAYNALNKNPEIRFIIFLLPLKK